MNKKTRILLAGSIVVAMILLAYFSSSSVKNSVDKKWNYAYMRITTIMRNFHLSQIKDESPGVGH